MNCYRCALDKWRLQFYKKVLILEYQIKSIFFVIKSVSPLASSVLIYQLSSSFTYIGKSQFDISDACFIFLIY